MSWPIEIPTRFIFGWGSLGELVGISGRHGWRRLLLVMGSNVARQPFASSFVDGLRNASLELEIWGDTEANPKVRAVEACVEEFRDAGIDAVLGFGGGSSMDQAKATVAGLASDAPVADLLAGTAATPEETLPLVLIPTTAGSGSESSWGSILTDSERGVKSGLRGKGLAADYAIVDPECTLNLPPSITMATGFDVLTHALETLLSKKRTEFTRMLSRHSIETVFTFLRRLKDDPGDREAREKMAHASTMAGINLALSSTCLPHRLQYPLGALTDCAHAEGLAALYPAWLEATLSYALAELADCALWVGCGDEVGTEKARAEWFVAAVLELMERLEITRRLSDFGIDRKQAVMLAGRVSGKLDNDPGDTSKTALEKLYLSSI